MRELTDRQKIASFMQRLGAAARRSARVYFTGGTTAVLYGWRNATVDIDVRIVPELDDLFRVLPGLKEELQINIELASPPDFIPAPAGWEERSIFIERHGYVDFFHFDPYSQALSKIERGHEMDLSDVRMMFRDGLIEANKLMELFRTIKSELYRYPAIDPVSFSRAVEFVVKSEDD